MPANKFVSLIEATAREIKEDYKTAQDHARRGDPQRAGHEGEATWKKLIGEWFPVGTTVTRKYIVGPGGEANEVDLILLKPDYPPRLFDQPSVLYTGVQAAFSCKLTLKGPDILEAIEQKRKINSVVSDGEPSWPEAMTGPIPFGILSQSTNLLKSSQNFRSDFRSRYEEMAHSTNTRRVTHPRDELDAILIADRGFWSTMYWALMPESFSEDNQVLRPATVFLQHAPGKELPGYPLVQFLIWLSLRLDGTTHSSLQALSSIFGLDGKSGDPTYWKTDIYPQSVLDNLGVLVNEFRMPKTV